MIGLRTSLWDPPWLMNESLELADLLRAMGVIPCDLRAGPKTQMPARRELEVILSMRGSYMSYVDGSIGPVSDVTCKVEVVLTQLDM